MMSVSTDDDVFPSSSSSFSLLLLLQELAFRRLPGVVVIPSYELEGMVR